MVYLYFGQYSFFTSVMTLGGMITAAFSGKIAAVIGRRQVIKFCFVFKCYYATVFFFLFLIL